MLYKVIKYKFLNFIKNTSGFKHGFCSSKPYSQRKNPNFVADFSSALSFHPTTMAANRMQRIFRLRSPEKSFVSRISPRNPCLPAVIVVGLHTLQVYFPYQILPLFKYSSTSSFSRCLFEENFLLNSFFSLLR